MGNNNRELLSPSPQARSAHIKKKMCFGFSDSWTVLVALRLVLGALEGGFFPGMKIK